MNETAMVGWPAAAAVVVLAGAAFGQCPALPGSLTETGRVVSTTADKNDRFGQAVVIDGDTMIVGAVHDDDLAGSGGAAHVFRFIGGAWTPEAVLVSALPNGVPPPDGSCEPGAMFGCNIPEFGEAVALQGDLAVVGAPIWRHANDVSARPGVGRVFVYRRAGNVWSQEAEFTPDQARTGDEFGSTLALDGTRLVIGAPLDDDECADGSYPDFDPAFDPSCFQNCQSGAVYVYELFAGVWTEVAKIHASDSTPGKRFGSRVAVEGDVIAVGAPIQDDGAVPTCFNGGTNVTNGHGAVYVYRLENDEVWVEEAKLLPPVPVIFTNFGESVVLENGRLYVGAPRAEHFNGEDQPGAVFVYENIGGVWTQVEQIVPSDFGGTDLIGSSLAVEGDFMAIGASGADIVDPNVNFCNSGAAYIYRRVAGTWQHQTKLTFSGAACGDHLSATGVALSSGHVAVGLPLHDDPQICCPCNMDGVVGVNVFDLLAFLDFWFAGIASRADFDRNLTVDVFDLLAFLDCWFPASAGDCGAPDDRCESGLLVHYEGIGDADGNGTLDICQP